MNDNSIKKIINFYLLSTSLKSKIRRGWIKWHVNSDRLESVAEHIYGTCILALAINSEVNLNIDINKVLKMLILHELEEVIIGDIVPTDNVSPQEKYLSGMQAVDDILSEISKKEEYYTLINEFNLSTTDEAVFALLCDKLEANLQAKIYSDNNQCDIFSKENEEMLNSKIIKDLKSDVKNNLFDLYSAHDSVYFKNNEIFTKIINYLKNNNVGG